MKKYLSLLLLVVSSVMFSGCATLFGGGSNQNINIVSKKEAVVDIYKVDDKNKERKIHSKVKVPSTINVQRSNENIVIKPSENSECNEYVVEKKTNGWFFGDVLALSLLSTTVDAVTGAMWEYDEQLELDCK